MGSSPASSLPRSLKKLSAAWSAGSSMPQQSVVLCTRRGSTSRISHALATDAKKGPSSLQTTPSPHCSNRLAGNGADQRARPSFHAGDGVEKGEYAGSRNAHRCGQYSANLAWYMISLHPSKRCYCVSVIDAASIVQMMPNFQSLRIGRLIWKCARAGPGGRGQTRQMQKNVL